MDVKWDKWLFGQSGTSPNLTEKKTVTNEYIYMHGRNIRFG